MNRNPVNPWLIVAVAGTAGMLIGPFAPWATALGGLISRNGVDGGSADGWIIFTMGIASAALIYRAHAQQRTNEVVLILVAAVACIVGISDFKDIAGRSGDIGVGWGLVLSIAGSGAVLLATALGFKRS